MALPVLILTVFLQKIEASGISRKRASNRQETWRSERQLRVRHCKQKAS